MREFFGVAQVRYTPGTPSSLGASSTSSMSGLPRHSGYELVLEPPGSTPAAAIGLDDTILNLIF